MGLPPLHVINLTVVGSIIKWQCQILAVLFTELTTQRLLTTMHFGGIIMKTMKS